MTALLDSWKPVGAYVVGGQFNVVAPAPIDGQTLPLQLDSDGNLLVSVVGGGGSGNPAAGPTGSPVPADADYLGINIGGVLTGVTGFSLTDSKAVAVAIVDSNGDQITSFGGGIQYADDAASGAMPTGTLSMGWDSANSKVRALKVDASQNLLVSISNATLAVTQSTSPWVVSGTVSATQGTSPWVISFTAPQHVIVDSGTVTVSGTVAVSNFPVTQNVAITSPVDGSGYVEVDLKTSLPAGAALIGQVEISDGTNVLFTSTHSGYVQFPSAQAVTLTSTTITGTVSVTQGTSPWVTQDNSDYADSAASGATPIGSLAAGWDSVNSKIRVLKVDTNQNLFVNLATALPAGTNVIGHVIVDSGTVSATQGTSPWVTSDLADVAGGGTSAPTKVLMVGGKTNDGTPQYDIMPLGIGGRSVIIEGFTGGTAVPISGSVTANQGTPNTLPNAWPSELTDGVNGPVAVKPANATALASDPALVVTLSPSSPSQPAMVDLLQTLILEVRAMRAALVYMITENQDVLTSDFDPASQDFQPVN